MNLRYYEDDFRCHQKRFRIFSQYTIRVPRALVLFGQREKRRLWNQSREIHGIRKRMPNALMYYCACSVPETGTK